MSEKDKIEKSEERKEAGYTIRSELYEAFKGGKRVNIFASGTYKGISGTILGMKNGSITLESETEDGEKYRTVLRVVDVKRVSVFQ